jgi:putative addiction module killer protein
MNRRKLLKYQLQNGKKPFDIWFNDLDNSLKSKVIFRLEKLSRGQLGEYKKLPKGISELKFKNGLRIYFSETEQEIILLLIGGNKSKQSNDIKKAQEYYQDYIERIKND